MQALAFREVDKVFAEQWPNGTERYRPIIALTCMLCCWLVRLGRILGDGFGFWLVFADVQFQTATRLGQPIVWGCFIVLRVGWFIFLVAGWGTFVSLLCVFSLLGKWMWILWWHSDEAPEAGAQGVVTLSMHGCGYYIHRT